MTRMPRLSRPLMGAVVLAALSAGCAAPPLESSQSTEDSAEAMATPTSSSDAPEAPVLTLRFSGLLPDRDYTLNLLGGLRATGRVVSDDGIPSGSAQDSNLKVEGERVVLHTSADLASSERSITLDVEISKRVISYSVVLSGRTSVELELAGATAVQGRPLQRNDIPFDLELPIEELPQDGVLRRTGAEFPCPKTADGRNRLADRHGHFSLCRP